LLIKAWGFGFWSDMNHIFGCLLLAEITGRVPVTHWGLNSLFTDGTDSDAFRLYFEPVTHFSVADLESLGDSTFFPSKWSPDSLRRDNFAKWDGKGSRLSGSFYLRRREMIAVSDFYIHLPDLLPFIPVTHEWHGKTANEVYRLVADRYLRLRPHILAEIDAFHRENMSDATPIIAVHARGTDKFREPDYRLSLRAYFDIIERDAPNWRIFLLTDQAQYAEAFDERYGPRMIVTDAHRSRSKVAVHHDRSVDAVRLGVEVIKDTYLALRCQKFVGQGLSNPSCMVAVLKDWAPRDCILLGESLLQRNFARRMRRRKKQGGLSGLIERVKRNLTAIKPV
jgi:protein O-GlcNAc transferase